MQKSTSTKTSTSTKNGKTVKTTVKEETTIYPDGRKEVKTTTTIDDGGNISEEPSPSGGSGTSVASKPANGSQGNQTLDECNQDALKAHNELRAKHGVPPVTLAKDLQEYAQKWAEHMAGKNDFNHSNCKLNGQSIGENIAYTGSSRPTDYAGKDFTQSWYSEIKDHKFDKDSQSVTGHFTQVVWKGTTEVGFGKAKSVDGCKVYVCGSYRPAGNMRGDFKNNVFPPK
uniref:SCP domain-containing protein n=1 Tax=Magallana gigas TaxID=29159 RepID=A0A8W8KQ66_MAGGI